MVLAGLPRVEEAQRELHRLLVRRAVRPDPGRPGDVAV
jgi:hypothetical protein